MIRVLRPASLFPVILSFLVVWVALAQGTGDLVRQSSTTLQADSVFLAVNDGRHSTRWLNNF